jgi:hypothetical protein
MNLSNHVLSFARGSNHIGGLKTLGVGGLDDDP